MQRSHPAAKRHAGSENGGENEVTDRILLDHASSQYHLD